MTSYETVIFKMHIFIADNLVNDVNICVGNAVEKAELLYSYGSMR